MIYKAWRDGKPSSAHSLRKFEENEMKKWVKAVIGGCFAYEFCIWFSGHLIISSPEWVELVMRLMAQVTAVLCGVLMVILLDEEGK